MELRRPTLETLPPRGHRPTAPTLPRSSLFQSHRFGWDGKPFTTFSNLTTAQDLGITVQPPLSNGFFQGFETFSVVAASEAAQVQAALSVEAEEARRAFRRGITGRSAPPHAHSLSPSSARSPLSTFDLFRAPTPTLDKTRSFGAGNCSRNAGAFVGGGGGGGSSFALPANVPAEHPARRMRRLMPPPKRLRDTSLLCQARDLEHKRELERLHPELRPKAGPRGNIDDADDAAEKAVLLKIKGWVADQVMVLSWDPDTPIADWRRVKTTRNGIHVTSISLVGCGLAVDLSEVINLIITDH